MDHDVFDKTIGPATPRQIRHNNQRSGSDQQRAGLCHENRTSGTTRQPRKNGRTFPGFDPLIVGRQVLIEVTQPGKIRTHSLSDLQCVPFHMAFSTISDQELRFP